MLKKLGTSKIRTTTFLLLLTSFYGIADTKECFTNNNNNCAQYCNKEGRCVDDNTNTFMHLGLSTTPVFRNNYKMPLVKINDSCKSPKEITTLPPGSFFKQTHDFAAQSEDEMVISVYEVDKKTQRMKPLERFSQHLFAFV